MHALIGIIGFLAVADDLRRFGELLGVGLILISGLVLIAVSFHADGRGVNRK